MAHEVFTFLNTRYDIDVALEVLEAWPRETVKVDPTVWADQYIGPDGGTSIGIGVNWDHVDSVDLNKPIVLAWFEGRSQKGYIVVDGYHRLAKGRRLGVESLPAYVLSKEESELIRL